MKFDYSKVYLKYRNGKETILVSVSDITYIGIPIDDDGEDLELVDGLLYDENGRDLHLYCAEEDLEKAKGVYK